jgi:hypothetical protein
MDNWKKINHLHLRAGFGLSPEEAIQKQGSNLTVEIRQLFNIKGNAFRLTEPAAFTRLNSQLDKMADGAAKRQARGNILLWKE